MVDRAKVGYSVVSRWNVDACAMATNPILVVDDEPDIRETLRNLLEEEGYAVRCASNGQEALDTLYDGSPLPSLILLDMMMPVMSGDDFLHAFHEVAAFRVIPVVVITASTTLRPQGATCMLRKPIDIDRLLAIIGERAACAMRPTV